MMMAEMYDVDGVVADYRRTAAASASNGEPINNIYYTPKVNHHYVERHMDYSEPIGQRS